VPDLAAPGGLAQGQRGPDGLKWRWRCATFSKVGQLALLHLLMRVVCACNARVVTMRNAATGAEGSGVSNVEMEVRDLQQSWTTR